MAQETTANEVIETFKITPEAVFEFDKWRNNATQRHVTDFVLGHTTRALYRLQPDHVRAVAKNSEHALGKIRKEVAQSVRPMVNWRPDFAFTHVLHYALETTGSLLTYQDFRDFCLNDTFATAMLVEPARAKVKSVERRGFDEPAVWDSFVWRIGLAYYSFLREMYTVAVLRADGRDVRAHPLADAVFRTDAWIGRTIVSLFIGNSEFRDGDGGRKKKPEEILGGADPAFRFRELRLGTQHVYGRVHMPAEQQIRRLGWAITRDPSLNGPGRLA